MRKSSGQRFREFRVALRENRDAPTAATGIINPEDDAPRRGSGRRVREKGYFRQYVRWLWPFRWAIAGVFAVAITSATLSLVLPRAIMYIVDHVLPAHDAAMLHGLGLALLLIICAQQTCDLFRNWWMATLNARVIFRLRQRLFNHLLRLPLHELSDMKTGGITSRISGDVDSITGLLQMAIVTPGVAGVKIVLTVTMLLLINWRMAFAAVLLLPPVILLNLFYFKRIRPIYRSLRHDRSDIDGRVVETFGGIRVVRAFGREAAEAARYGVAHHTVIRKQLLARYLEQFVWSGWGFLIPICGLVIIWLGGTLALQDQATIGGIMAFQMYLMMLLSPVNAIVESYGQTQQALAAMERVFDVLASPADKPDRPRAIPAPRRVERIEFDSVRFAYRSGLDVLTDVCIDVSGGTSVALVGPSGSGKTTLTNLVARFYDPTAGAIRLNGVDLRDLQLRSYRRMLGLVSQDVFLFDGTIAENIAYGRRDATETQIVSAARRANADDYIRTFPDGYQTIVGERGVRLSGGQAQRVSIARALLADPAILILDEATSNLDTESEQLIQAALRELLSDRTTFVIAHRLSTVMHADLIVVLESGRVVETGSHATLMSTATRYRTMVERQRRGAELTEPVSDLLA
ncbi:MAG: putative multidrug export ATP-binding/permease protein [Phycisphaerae bacterium]|nr:putative multidrug export ATP-binding/permease protein [Phycisphaerae bacterium]